MSDGIYFIEGFEGDEDSLVWETMPLVRNDDHARSGDFGIGKHGLGVARAESPLFATTLGVIVGFAFRWRETDDDFGGNVVILEIRGPGDIAHVQLAVNAQKNLVVLTQDEVGAMVARAYSSPRTLDAGAWYYIEYAAELHDTAGRVVVQLNGGPGVVGTTGGEVIDVGSIRTVRPAISAPGKFYNQFHIGVLGAFLNEDHNFSFDDIYVRELSEGFLGDQQVFGRALEDDRAVDFVRSSGTKNFDMVDELAPDEDGTYNETAEDGSEDIFEIPDSDFGGTIHCVQLVARAKKTETQVWTLQTMLELDGTKSYGTAYYLSHPDYETLPPDVYGDAPGETGWTVAQLNDVGVGYRAEAP